MARGGLQRRAALIARRRSRRPLPHRLGAAILPAMTSKRLPGRRFPGRAGRDAGLRVRREGPGRAWGPGGRGPAARGSSGCGEAPAAPAAPGPRFPAPAARGFAAAREERFTAPRGAGARCGVWGSVGAAKQVAEQLPPERHLSGGTELPRGRARGVPGEGGRAAAGAVRPPERGRGLPTAAGPGAGLWGPRPHPWARFQVTVADWPWCR